MAKEVKLAQELKKFIIPCKYRTIKHWSDLNKLGKELDKLQGVPFATADDIIRVLGRLPKEVIAAISRSSMEKNGEQHGTRPTTSTTNRWLAREKERRPDAASNPEIEMMHRYFRGRINQLLTRSAKCTINKDGILSENLGNFVTTRVSEKYRVDDQMFHIFFRWIGDGGGAHEITLGFKSPSLYEKAISLLRQDVLLNIEGNKISQIFEVEPLRNIWLNDEEIEYLSIHEHDRQQHQTSLLQHTKFTLSELNAFSKPCPKCFNMRIPTKDMASKISPERYEELTTILVDNPFLLICACDYRNNIVISEEDRQIQEFAERAIAEELRKRKNNNTSNNDSDKD